MRRNAAVVSRSCNGSGTTRTPQIWLKVIFFKDPLPSTATDDDPGVPSLARHPAFPKGSVAVVPAVTRQKKGGAPPDSSEEVWSRTLLRGTDAMDKLVRAVRFAQGEAIDSLRKPWQPGSPPKVADMMLLFADLASPEEHSRNELRAELGAIDDRLLSPVDLRYKARALYLLGDNGALCDYVRASYASAELRDHTQRYYEQRASDEGDGTSTLRTFCSHIAFARRKESAALAALYLRSAAELIQSKRTTNGWSTALGNLTTTRALVRQLDRLARVKLACAHDGPPCRDLAEFSANRIRDAVAAARSAILNGAR